jgi:hypothetical protein
LQKELYQPNIKILKRIRRSFPGKTRLQTVKLLPISFTIRENFLEIFHHINIATR